MNNNQNVGNNQPINQTNTNQFNGQYQNQNINTYSTRKSSNTKQCNKYK